MRGDPWGDADDARLSALWATGLSTAAIGEAMGRSKNSIVGRAHRLQLAPRPSPINLRRTPVVQKAKRAARVTLPPMASKPEASDAPAPPPAVSPAPVVLSATRTCQWISGPLRGEATVFCDAPALVGKSWCPTHHAQVFVPTRRVRYVGDVADVSREAAKWVPDAEAAS